MQQLYRAVFLVTLGLSTLTGTDLCAQRRGGSRGGGDRGERFRSFMEMRRGRGGSEAPGGDADGRSRRGGWDRGRSDSDSDGGERFQHFMEMRQQSGEADRFRSFGRPFTVGESGSSETDQRPFGGEWTSDGRRGDSRNGDARRKEASSEGYQPKPRPRVTVDLPEKYRDRDVNKDGQIGLYEWERKAFAQFFVMDRNGDGFLTPREIVAAESVDRSERKSASRSLAMD